MTDLPVAVPPEAPSLRPRDLPRMRDVLVEWYRGPIAPEILAMEADEKRLPYSLVNPEPLGDALATADLYHVSTHMSELVDAAARSLPEFTLTAEDPPSQRGLVWFERAILDSWEQSDPPNGTAIEISVSAASWQVIDARVLVAIWVDRDQVAFPSDTVKADTLSRWRSWFPAVVPIGHNLLPLGPAGLGPGHSGHAALASVKTTWLLIRQPLAEIELLEPDRVARRQAARQQREPASVRVITLRRPPGPDHGGHVDWHHSWIVRGHWRSQPFGPGRQQHRPVWISPYVKGPEDAPLLGGEKVYAWTR